MKIYVNNNVMNKKLLLINNKSSGTVHTRSNKYNFRLKRVKQKQNPPSECSATKEKQRLLTN